MPHSKKSLRQSIRTLRQALSESEQHDAAIGVWLQLIKAPCFLDAEHIGFYMPIQGELNTLYTLQTALKENKKVFLPVVTSGQPQLKFYHYTPSMKMVLNKFGILEPDPQNTYFIEPTALDLVFAPLVAFDSACNRLGMGQGFYDKTFAFCKEAPKPILVGLAYEFQKVDHLPNEAHDIPMDFVVTHLATYTRTPSVSG